MGVALGIELDHRAVKQDQLELRSLADCVRLLSLPVPRDSADLHDHRRVAKTLLQALGNLERGTDAALLADLEAFCFGWAALPASTDLLPKMMVPTAAAGATRLGRQMAERRIAAAEAAVWQQIEDREKKASWPPTRPKPIRHPKHPSSSCRPVRCWQVPSSNRWLTSFRMACGP